jgi:uncharacterized damage-inducible protein DinB
VTDLDFPSPMTVIEDDREVLLGYLDFFREIARGKVGGMASAAQTASRLPSGWTPLELLNHLSHVERRWLEWGFAGAAIADPWADQVDGRWHTALDFAAVSSQLDRQAEVTRSIVHRHELIEIGQPGDRWDGEAPATLGRILLHLVQEYARHCGHLDVVRELSDGATGESQG